MSYRSIQAFNKKRTFKDSSKEASSLFPGIHQNSSSGGGTGGGPITGHASLLH